MGRISVEYTQAMERMGSGAGPRSTARTKFRTNLAIALAAYSKINSLASFT